MELTTRLKYVTFILIGIIFIITGLALNELSILGKVGPGNFDKWYQFLAPWVGTDGSGGLPVPW